MVYSHNGLYPLLSFFYYLLVLSIFLKLGLIFIPAFFTYLKKIIVEQEVKKILIKLVEENNLKQQSYFL